MLKDKIKNLIKLIENTEIEEIEVSSFWGAQKIRLSKSGKVNNSVYEAPVQPTKEVLVQDDKPKKNIDNLETIQKEETSDIISEPIQNEEVSASLNLTEIKAPLVGTFYSSPKPDSPPFVNVGDKIKKGDTVCIIEAMKIFNEIESDASGTVMQICIENGNPVEFDQVIIKVSAD
tara:strand:- start:2281 stop:2805 length:525 start_codon:yes stop_codon:yes gene_type:complete